MRNELGGDRRHVDLNPASGLSPRCISGDSHRHACYPSLRVDWRAVARAVKGEPQNYVLHKVFGGDSSPCTTQANAANLLERVDQRSPGDILMVGGGFLTASHAK